MTLRSMNVVLGDGHLMFRQGLAALLHAHEGIAVVGGAGTSRAAAELVRVREADAAVLDARLPSWPIGQTIETCRRYRPKLQVVVVTAHPDDALGLRLREQGAASVVAKTDSVLQVLSALAADGPSEVTNDLLTSRELEVLALMAKALTNQQIASYLGIAQATVKRHASNLFAKLTAVSRLDAVEKGHRAGLL